MIRLLFEKTGNAVWISHLDLMRLFQRAFQRAGLPLTHTHGFNPRPSVSIALPMSVGVESGCELLDFALDGTPVPCAEIRDRLNDALVPGVRILDVYENGCKLKNLAWLDCCLKHNQSLFSYSPRSLLTTLPMFHRWATVSSARRFSSSLAYSTYTV